MNGTSQNYNFGHKKIYIKTIEGECACQQVKFSLKVMPQVMIIKCTCQLCLKLQRSHHITQPNRFDILIGKEKLSNYQSPYHENAKNYFCSNCGIHIYFQAQNSTSICLNTILIDRNQLAQVTYVECFQGRDWNRYLDNTYNKILESD